MTLGCRTHPWNNAKKALDGAALSYSEADVEPLNLPGSLGALLEYWLPKRSTSLLRLCRLRGHSGCLRTEISTAANRWLVGSKGRLVNHPKVGNRSVPESRLLISAENAVAKGIQTHGMNEHRRFIALPFPGIQSRVCQGKGKATGACVMPSKPNRRTREAFAVVSYSNMLMLNALAQLLTEKGILTKEEVLARIEILRKKMPRKSAALRI